MEIICLLTSSFILAVSSLDSYDPQLFLENGCPRPDAIKNGNFLLAPGHDRVQYLCDEGYMEVGYMFASCKNGNWDRDAPACVATGCKSIKTMRHGYIQLSYGGAIARFRCDDGYDMKGPEVIVCDGSRWNGTQPECIDPHSYKRGGKRGSYHSKSNMASPEFRKYDDSLPKTHEDWLHESDYTCIEKLDVVTPPVVLHASPFTKWILLEGKPRLYTVYRCKWGFVPVGNHKNLYCQHRNWVGPRPKCVHSVGKEDTYVHFPGDEPKPDSSSSHNEWLAYSDYSCLSHDGTITAPAVANARRNAMSTSLDGKPHLFVEYFCNDGYQLDRPERKYMYCHKNAWWGEQPVCIPGFSSNIDDGFNDGFNGGYDNNNKNNQYSNGYSNAGFQDTGFKDNYPKNSFVNPWESDFEKEVSCDDSQCEQMCVVNNNRITCSCTRGYKLNIDGQTCADIDECAERNGGCHHACQNTLGSFKCSCHGGYRLLADGQSCRPRRMRYGRPKRPNWAN